MSTVSELLDEHVTLTVESLDRIYLNGYVPTLQTPGQLVSFLTVHRGNPIPSPALLKRMDKQFEASLDAFAEANDLARLKFERKERKDDIAAQHRADFTGSEGVYLIGVAQEKCYSYKGTTSHDSNSLVSVLFSRQATFVSHYYFYLVDSDFGPAFIKVSTYAPYGIRVCVNGHEWAKRQLEQEGIAYDALDNGFKSCADPQRLQEICDSLGPSQIKAFADKWLARLPMPLTNEDRAAGYDYMLSLWQVEISRTQVFDVPVHGREFFEEVIRENLDLGRPDRVRSLVFDRQIYKNTPGSFRTRVFEDGVHPSLHIEYKSCHVKQYFKENWALRTETTINNPGDFNIGKLLSNLEKLRAVGRDINLRLLEVQRTSQACTLLQSTVEDITHPTVTQDGQRVPALRFGDPRPMALWAALTLMCTLPQGFSNATLRQHVADLLGPHATYKANQMTYDLRRLKRKNLIERVPKTHSYRLTNLGLKAALFFSKLHARIFKPASASLPDATTHAPSFLTEALTQVQLAIEQLVAQAKLEPAC